MKLKPLKKATISDQILAVANKYPNGFMAEDVLCTPKQKPSVARALKDLVDKGVLKHNPTLGDYSINKNSETVVYKSERQPVNGKSAEDRDAETIAFLAQQTIVNGEKYKTLHEQYTDALAIIRYLEGKVFVLLQRAKNEDDLRQ